MRRLPFIPARDPRHRSAALALCRALLRSASRIPLPTDVRAATPGVVGQLVKRRFVGNRAYTSLRLVYAAMAAGYDFLTLFAKAQTPGSPEHAQVVHHIRTRLSSAAAARAAHPPPRKPPARSFAEPLITNTAPPGRPPAYTSSVLPRPRSALPADRPRRVPSLCTTANDQPFLRIKKPQPRALSRMVGRKDRVFQRKIYRIVDIDEELVPGAALEDEWDRLVADQMRREAAGPGGEGGGPKTTFSWSVQLARLWWEWRVEKTWQDWTARGTALNELVERERALAEQEMAGSAKPEGRDPAQDQRRRATPPRGHVRPNVAEHSAPPLPLLSAINTRLGRDALDEEGEDPFLSPSWTALVEAEQPRLMKWLARGAAGRNGGAAASK
ncbi:Uncharacterized protein TCAP_04350 [Tolypocladium capitatum]|uniref:Ubiquitin-conjugating enzyme n=1 Tax=Tolypocladium capitatum TaxID=45235 RepID=A0A2K3QDX6_9HYPO|nr:Uncharacterized protein TCAP_04350 [Tolypocladium capitatum]